MQRQRQPQRVHLLATIPVGLLRPGAEIDLRLYATPAVDAAFRNVATTPALEALCAALLRQLRLVSLQLYGNAFGVASRAALLHAAAAGPLGESLRLQLVDGAHGDSRNPKSSPEQALVGYGDEARSWASDEGLASGAFDSVIEFADGLSSEGGSADAVAGSLARTQPWLWTLQLEHDAFASQRLT